MDGTPWPTLTHRSSRRVTAGIGFHSFVHTPSPASFASTPPPGRQWLRPTQHVTLQFPDSLDPAAGKHGMRVEDRQATFTPCRVGDDEEDRGSKTTGLSILTRNGRITGLLGLPRPYETLTAEVLEVGGGFPPAALARASLCIAGGTGIAPFLTLRAVATKTLCWSVRSDSFGVVEFALCEGLLDVSQWSAVRVFVTEGEDAGDVSGADKPAAWWESTFATLRTAYPADRLWLSRRRMTAEDAVAHGGVATDGETQTVLFCGSKSFEWQIRMWTLMLGGTAYTTDSA